MFSLWFERLFRCRAGLDGINRFYLAAGGTKREGVL